PARRGPLSRLDAGVASSQCLAHRAVVITRLNASNVEPPILGLDRPFRSEDDARGNCALPARVTDVEAFDPLGRFGHLQVLLQRLEMGLDPRTIEGAQA